MDDWEELAGNCPNGNHPQRKAGCPDFTKAGARGANWAGIEKGFWDLGYEMPVFSGVVGRRSGFFPSPISIMDIFGIILTVFCCPVRWFSAMPESAPRIRWYRPTPGWLVVLLLATTSFLYLSERFQWFGFNSHKGWSVLLAVGMVGVVLVLMFLWLVVALILRWRFQFSVRSLLVLVVAVALPFSWLAVEMKKARDNKKAINEIQAVGGTFAFHLTWTEWVRQFVGDESYFVEPMGVTLRGGRPGGASLPRMNDDQFRALMPALRQFPRLIHLDVGLAEITDGVVDDITTLTNLEILDIGGTSITDDALSRFHSLPRLKWLALSYTKVTDGGLAYLAGMNQLQWLDLGHTKVTDGGLAHLVGLNQLHELHLKGTHVTDGAVAKLQRALPNCKIYR